MIGVDICYKRSIYKRTTKQEIMKTIEKSGKRITTIAVLILIAALIGTGLYSANRSITKGLNNKLKSELMLSKSLPFRKKLKFRNQINSLTSKNADLDKLLAETSQKLSEKEAQLNRMDARMETLKH